MSNCGDDTQRCGGTKLRPTRICIYCDVARRDSCLVVTADKLDRMFDGRAADVRDDPALVVATLTSLDCALCVRLIGFIATAAP